MKPSEAARIIGCATSHVRHLIRTGKLKAKMKPSTDNRWGYVWDISRREAERYRDAPTNGRGYPRGKPRSKK